MGLHIRTKPNVIAVELSALRQTNVEIGSTAAPFTSRSSRRARAPT